MLKSLKEKICEIKNALEKEGINRKEIDNHAEYCIARRILNDQNVREMSVDKLLSKINKIRTKRKKGKKQKITTLGVKESLIENVIDDDVCKTGSFEKNDIEKSIKKQKSVKEISTTKVEELVAGLREENERLRQENQSLKEEMERKDRENRELRKKSKTVIGKSATIKEVSDTVIDERKIVVEEVDRHEGMIKEVLERIENLEKQIAIDKSIARTEKNPGLHGFSVSRLSSGYWQAVRRIDGRPQCVYIGRDADLAQEKIEKWLAKHYPDMLKERT